MRKSNLSKSPKRDIFSLLVFFALLILSCPPSSDCGQSTGEFKKLIKNGGFIVHGDFGTLQSNENRLFIPASTLKIITSLGALESLGENYRFQTTFSFDGQNNLYIEGFGDPFLTSEVIHKIAEELKRREVKQISSILLDASSFTTGSSADGSANSHNPYDAPNGALAVNFNSVPVLISDDGKISSGEPQTPTLPLMYELGRTLPPGNHRVNINTLKKSGSISPALRYVGELMTAIFAEHGIEIQNGFATGVTPTTLNTFYNYKSAKTVQDMIKSCMQYSNNYIANQLFLACGIAAYGYPATWEKSRLFFKEYIKNILGLDEPGIHMEEGAGLSRKNSITPTGLLTAVKRFKPYAHLLSKKRGDLVKSGTLSDVFCYAGFISRQPKLLPFVIMLNQKENNRDQLLRRMKVALSMQQHTTSP